MTGLSFASANLHRQLVAIGLDEHFLKGVFYDQNSGVVGRPMRDWDLRDSFDAVIAAHFDCVMCLYFL